MSTRSSSNRADEVRRRRSTARRTTRTVTHASDTTLPGYKPKAAYLPGEAKSVRNARLMRSTAGARKGQGTFVRETGKKSRSRGRNSGVAFNVGGTKVRTPALALPNFNSRWVSGGLTLVLAFVLYAMWTASTFIVSAADVSGNERLASEDINAKLGIIGEPIFKAIPSVIEDTLRNEFPDLQSVSVRLGLPNKVIVKVVERTPVLAWYRDGIVKWIDAGGVAFKPRGDVPNLVEVAADNDPPALPQDPQKNSYDQLFITPEMVNALVALAPNVPAGITMTYDPQYGAGWQDPRGWMVYFGQNMKDIAMKLKVYQSIVDTFTRQGIQPTIISVAYLDAPFYK